MAQYHNIKEDTDVTEDILDLIEEMLESRMRPRLKGAIWFVPKKIRAACL
jgi:hypothetical protein